MSDLKKILELDAAGGQDVHAQLIVEIYRGGVECVAVQPSPFMPGKINQFAFEQLPDPLQMADAISMLSRQENIFQTAYERVTVCYNFPEVMFVPVKLYDPLQQEQLLDGAFGVDALAQTFTARLPNGEAVIWRVNKSLHEQMEGLFPNAEFTHRFVPEFFEVQKFNAIEIRCYAKFIQLIGYGNKRLPVVSYKSYTSAADIVYELLSFSAFVHAEPKEVPVIYSGHMDEQSAVFEEIQKYFLHLQPAQLPGQENWNLQSDIYAPHYFYPLLNLAKCAS